VQLNDFYHKTCREGVIAMSAAKKQSMLIITSRCSGWLPAAFLAVAMTIISADHHGNCASPVQYFKEHVSKRADRHSRALLLSDWESCAGWTQVSSPEKIPDRPSGGGRE
jgi:hypothetical protein